jgi:hypothetical protein
MAEIMAQDYEDAEGPVSFGREEGEAGGNRLDCDDVDDYNNWSTQPPETRDGTNMSDLHRWRRTAAVEWVDQSDLTTVSGVATNIKRITVTVDRNGTRLAELVAVRSLGLPPPELGPNILLIVGDDKNPTAQESARVVLMESWGYTVSLLTAADPQPLIDTAVASADVIYVSEAISDVLLGTKLVSTTLGVVNEEASLADEFGFCSSASSGTALNIRAWSGPLHYIMEPFGTASFSPFTSAQPVFVLNGSIPPGLEVIAGSNTTGPNYYGSAAVLNLNDDMHGGGTAAGRRVLMPWGSAGFDINALNADGQTLMKRAIEWAANLEQP